MSASTWVAEDEAEYLKRSLDLAATSNALPSQYAWAWDHCVGLTAYRCRSCGQGWLVCSQGVIGGTDLCFGRVSKEELEAIVSDSVWPDHFDAINRAVRRGDLNAIRGQVRAYPSCLRSDGTFEERSSGRTPLHAAVEVGSPEIVEFLLDHGADLDACTHYYGSALHYAVDFDHMDIVQQLLERGIGLESVDHDGFTALHHAFYDGKLDIARVLLEFGAEPRRTTEAEFTALGLAREPKMTHLPHQSRQSDV